MYRFIVFWIRLAGTINSLTTEAKWRTKTFSEEIGIVKSDMDKNVKRRLAFLSRIRRFINKE